MNATQTIFDNLPEKKVLWDLVDKQDFKALIDALLKTGVHENNLGELLFSFVDQAVA
jgi:hypothetical protein